MNAWKQLQVCLQDGRSLAWLIERVGTWRAEVNRQLEINNLSAEFKAVCQSGTLPCFPVCRPVLNYFDSVFQVFFFFFFAIILA